MSWLRILLFPLCLLLAAPMVWAENSTRGNGYVVHHNAFGADFLSPEIAARYGIQRSRNQGLLNVSIIKETPGATGQPVTALVRVQANNLAGLVKTIELREIREQDAIYYIGEFPVIDGEIVNFNLEVTPAGESQSIRAKFSQDFYTR